METHAINFSFTGRYFVSGDLNKAEQVWFVLHGYGQLAEYFCKKFECLIPYKIAVVAPEALSKFYLEETFSRMRSGNNRVGASWMTKENRLCDIANYITFLNSVYQTVMKPRKLPVTVLGFSQGAATASRWIMDGKMDFDRFILWAGLLPADIDFSTGKELFKNKTTWVVYGDEDPFLNTTEPFAELNLLTQKLGISPTQLTFSGGHNIDEGTLLKLV